MKGKPVAIIIFDILLWLAVGKCVLFVMIFTIQMLDPQIAEQLIENVHIGIGDWIVGIYNFIISIIYLVFLTHIFLHGSGKQWGRKIFLYIVAFDMISAMAKNLFILKSLTPSIPVIIFNCAVLFYLTRPKVKEQFK